MVKCFNFIHLLIILELSKNIYSIIHEYLYRLNINYPKNLLIKTHSPVVEFLDPGFILINPIFQFLNLSYHLHKLLKKL
jgi:hypothetical protein